MQSDEEIAERFGLIPVNYDDPVDGSPVAAVAWRDLVPVLEKIDAIREAWGQTDGYDISPQMNAALEAVWPSAPVV